MMKTTNNILNLILIFAIFLTLGAAFVKCGSNGVSDVEAADRRKIETFTYQEDTFVLVTESAPIIDISNGTTQYTINSDGDISFINDSGAQSFDLNSGDTVIQNPPSRSVTLVRIT